MVTAVDWLLGEIKKLAFDPAHHLGLGDVRITQGMIEDWEEIAKPMNRKQIIEAYVEGWDCNERGEVRWIGDKYYDQTYGK